MQVYLPGMPCIYRVEASKNKREEEDTSHE